MKHLGWENNRGGYYILKLMQAIEASDYTVEEISTLLGGDGGLESLIEALETMDVDSVAEALSHTDSGLRADVTALQEAMLTKADTDGDYPDMSVGHADSADLANNIETDTGVTDKIPYLFRTSGGAIDIGDRETDKVIGGTIAWNQLLPFVSIDSTKTENGVSFTDNRDGSFTFSTEEGGATANAYLAPWSSSDAPKIIAGHKYLFSCLTKQGTASTFYAYATSVGFTSTLPKDYGNGAIYSCSSNSIVTIVIGYVKSGTVITTPVKAYPQLFDLTQMFGSAIADYIYSLEQATAGAGVSWFKKLFPKDYYEYNAGELLSVNAASHDMVGFNQFDKSTAEYGKYLKPDGTIGSNANRGVSDYIRVIPNTKYYIKNSVDGAIGYAISFYDADKNFISIGGFNSNIVSGIKTTPNDCYYVRIAFMIEYKDTCCFNLSWDGERDGEYEPYVKHTYPLDDDLELCGILKLDAQNRLYADGDVYKSDGEVELRYGIITFDGTENWIRSAAGVIYLTLNTTTFQYAYKPSVSAISNKYVYHGTAAGSYSTTLSNGEFLLYYSSTASDTREIAILDTAYETVEAFKTTLQSSPLVVLYELATPITSSADPYQNPQIVDDFGTEEYVDNRDVPIPVGHNTFYPVNLKAKLEMQPTNPDEDGNYVVQHDSGNNYYVNLSTTNVIAGLLAKLPDPPAEAGSYVLTVTVADGEDPVYSWEGEAQQQGEET